MDDARDVDAAALLVDDRSGAFVVLGERGRTHFFSAEGRLVSSVRYRRDAVARKIKLGKWRAATADERERLRKAVAD